MLCTRRQPCTGAGGSAINVDWDWEVLKKALMAAPAQASGVSVKSNKYNQAVLASWPAVPSLWHVFVFCPKEERR